MEPEVSSVSQQQQQVYPPSLGVESRVGTLEVRVASIEDGIKTIVLKLDERARVPWVGIISAGFGAVGLIVTLVGGIGALAFTPLSAAISDIKLGISRYEAKSDQFMKREDIEAQVNGVRNSVREQMDIAKERRNDLQAKTDDRIARSEKDLAYIQTQVVPRAEHAEQWSGQRARDENLQRQLDELRRATSDVATPRDALQRLQAKVDELEHARLKLLSDGK